MNSPRCLDCKVSVDVTMLKRFVRAARASCTSSLAASSLKGMLPILPAPRRYMPGLAQFVSLLFWGR